MAVEYRYHDALYEPPDTVPWPMVAIAGGKPGQTGEWSHHRCVQLARWFSIHGCNGSEGDKRQALCHYHAEGSVAGGCRVPVLPSQGGVEWLNSPGRHTVGDLIDC